jgi:hypothetical protein
MVIGRPRPVWFVLALGLVYRLRIDSEACRKAEMGCPTQSDLSTAELPTFTRSISVTSSLAWLWWGHERRQAPKTAGNDLNVRMKIPNRKLNANASA